MVEAADLVERGLDRLARLGVGELAGLDREDGLGRDAGRGRELVLEQVLRPLGIGSGNREVLGRAPGLRAEGDANQDDGSQETDEAALPAAGEGSGERGEER